VVYKQPVDGMIVAAVTKIAKVIDNFFVNIEIPFVV
jgi:hypothetical protein